MSQTAIEAAFHKASNAYWESAVLSETSPDRLKAACLAYAAALANTQGGVKECPHEAYLGHCVHCNAPFVDGRAVVKPAALTNTQGGVKGWQSEAKAQAAALSERAGIDMDDFDLFVADLESTLIKFAEWTHNKPHILSAITLQGEPVGESPATPEIKWKRTEQGYTSKDGRFTITKSQGRAYTRGPFRNWWSVRDIQDDAGHNDLPSLIEAKQWAEKRI
ncbi:hypothetical protein QFZ34_002109 [Phyllobacterium ifriqiyense]|uniref:Uncharacterized protein n=1 Tax=Phyllobacterium ifriqiyense TaxID=314238 RepID=A0ABU0S838_9HYPH|nr:hypothetical protein [Phyllobacterium ifriqiyense]MDQ0996927.1 hypothetical protein [Phyllobacterium ifriqiyense]